MTSPTPINPMDPTHPIARIFLSHSHHDDAFALRLAEQLRAAWAYVWLDRRDIKDGDFLKRINEGLVKCDWLVLIETPTALASEPVEMEVNAAQNRVLYHQMRGVIRFVAAARDPRRVPPTWATLQYYDATSNYSAALAGLLDAVRDTSAALAEPISPRPAGRGVGGEDPPTPTLPTLPAAPPSPEQTVAQRLLRDITTDYDAGDWHAVADKSALLLRLAPDVAGVSLYRMQGRALLELGDGPGAITAFEEALKGDPFDLPTLRATARAYLRANQPAKAAPLLQDAIALVATPAERLDILREYVPVLQALERWGDVLARGDEALRLQRDDPGWLALRLDALTHLGRTEEALAAARGLADRPQATAAEWVTLARMTANTTHHNRNQIRAVLDEADRRFPNDAALAAASRELLPWRRWPFARPPFERFPERLEGLGFAAAGHDNVAYILPPLCPVPAGPFLMGSDPRQDNQAQANEQPQGQVELAAFQIAKFPVTVAEYACFVASGHTAPGDWSAQQGKLDHPVVSVSWHDATAYAAWLARLTGQPWTLPSEAQWEKAVRWDAEHPALCLYLYPWGAADVRFCGHCGSRIEPGQQICPDCGAEMAGNAGEWTSSLFKSYPYTASDGRENPSSTGNRVLRGGSWSGDSRHVRAAYRSGNLPVYALVNVGFRVALPSAG